MKYQIFCREVPYTSETDEVFIGAYNNIDETLFTMKNLYEIAAKSNLIQFAEYYSTEESVNKHVDGANVPKDKLEYITGFKMNKDNRESYVYIQKEDTCTIK